MGIENVAKKLAKEFKYDAYIGKYDAYIRFSEEMEYYIEHHSFFARYLAENRKAILDSCQNLDINKLSAEEMKNTFSKLVEKIIKKIYMEFQKHGHNRCLIDDLGFYTLYSPFMKFTDDSFGDKSFEDAYRHKMSGDTPKEVITCLLNSLYCYILEYSFFLYCLIAKKDDSYPYVPDFCVHNRSCTSMSDLRSMLARKYDLCVRTHRNVLGIFNNYTIYKIPSISEKQAAIQNLCECISKYPFNILAYVLIYYIDQDPLTVEQLLKIAKRCGFESDMQMYLDMDKTALRSAMNQMNNDTILI